MTSYSKVIKTVKEFNAKLNSASLIYIERRGKLQIRPWVQAIYKTMTIISKYIAHNGTELSKGELEELLKYYQHFHGLFKRYEQYY